MRLQSAMSHDFSLAPQANIQRSSFDRTFKHKTTFDAGYLIPLLVDEVLPGDTFNVSMTGFARLATPIFPIMDDLFLETFFFFVPNRLLWDNWQKFCGERDNPDDSIDFIVPEIDAPVGTGFTSGSLFDYLGMPIGVAGVKTYSLVHRAYNLIWNQWFRDQNLQDSVVVDKDDGPDDPTDYVLLKRGKRYDYFTSCLPWAQKGTAVELPLGVSAPIRSNTALDAQGRSTVIFGSTGETGTDQTAISFTAGTGALVGSNPGNLASGQLVWPLSTDNNYNYADLSSATAATINDIRQAFQIQRLLERDARGGTRYVELLRSHFNVISPDARLQRPEYLGGGTTPVIVNPVAQTSSTDATTPQGNLAGIGTCSPYGHGFTKSFVEHGILIGLVCVRSDLSYQQGLDKMYSRQSRYDFYWPALAHLGEQAVLNKEIYCDGTANDELVFGYQERYAEYRYKRSMVTGLFRTAATGTLDSWHLAQNFSALPVLTDGVFIQETPPMTRIKAVSNEPDFIFDSIFKMKCAREMPMYSVPGFIDHF